MWLAMFQIFSSNLLSFISQNDFDVKCQCYKGWDGEMDGWNGWIAFEIVFF